MTRRTTIPTKAQDMARLKELGAERRNSQSRSASLTAEIEEIVKRRVSVNDVTQVEMAEALGVTKAAVNAVVKR